MDPRQVVINMLINKMGGTPMGDNLLNLARNNDTMGIERIARNICSQQGKDFDKEFSAFKQQMGFK